MKISVFLKGLYMEYFYQLSQLVCDDKHHTSYLHLYPERFKLCSSLISLRYFVLLKVVILLILSFCFCHLFLLFLIIPKSGRWSVILFIMFPLWISLSYIYIYIYIYIYTYIYIHTHTHTNVSSTKEFLSYFNFIVGLIIHGYKKFEHNVLRNSY